MIRLPVFLSLFIAALAANLACGAVARADDDLSVYAAASLGGALDDLAAAWEADTGGRLTPVLAGSSAIARQVQAGAPADVVILANPGWMEILEASGDIMPGTRFDLLTNRLVLIGPATDGAVPVDMSDPAAVRARIGTARVALALTEAVPAGIYARAALDSLGLWELLRTNVVEADNVRAALALVALGAAQYGIVYETDAVAEPQVVVLATVPETSHPPILYPAAAVAGGDAGVADRALQFLRSPLAQAIYTAHGFGIALPDPADG